MNLNHEPMSPIFDKFHVEGLPRSAVFHRFAAPDSGPAHDHPFSITSFIVYGGYEEEVFDKLTGKSQLVSHYEGDSFSFPATHVHRITRLFTREVWTLILPGEWEQKSGFWEFREDGSYYRAWDEPEFYKITGAANPPPETGSATNRP